MIEKIVLVNTGTLSYCSSSSFFTLIVWFQIQFNDLLLGPVLSLLARILVLRKEQQKHSGSSEDRAMVHRP